MSDLESGYFIKHEYCIGTETQGKNDCDSSDGLALYEKDTESGVSYSGYCWVCKQFMSQKDLSGSSLAAGLGLSSEGLVTERKTFERKSKQPALTKEEVKEMITTLNYDNKNYRGIKEEYARFFGHLTQFNSKGEVSSTYYPETRDGGAWPTGYKIRYHPKSFGKVGQTGLSSDMAGYIKFKDYVGHRDVLIVGGEVDMVSAFQMLRDNQKRKGQEDYAPVAVVSPTTGEGSAITQIRKHYEWLCGFESIYLGLDNDEKGLEAMEAIAAILPRDKIKVIHWTHNDPNNMLKLGKEKQFLSDWYNAIVYQKNGIITSGEADKTIEDELMRPKMPLPSFMSGLQKKMAGGVPLGYIVNWIAESGVGKSTLVNEVIRYWIFNSDYKVGILSLELTAAQYMIAMLSREVGSKINLIESPEEAVAFVQRPEVMEARRHLAYTEDGDSRFVILDERDGELSEVKRQCETLVNKYGCQILVIDPIQDLFEGVSMDHQNDFLKWMKVMLKKGVTFSNVCHVKKGGGSSTDKEGKRIMRELSEDDVHGISAIVKSAGANLFMSRNKYEDSEVAKNTTYPTLGKCRWSGNTGKIAPWYYSNTKHTMYDLHEYFRDNPSELPEGYDLEYSPFDRKPKDSQGLDFKKRQQQVKSEKDFMEDSIF